MKWPLYKILYFILKEHIKYPIMVFGSAVIRDGSHYLESVLGKADADTDCCRHRTYVEYYGRLAGLEPVKD